MKNDSHNDTHHDNHNGAGRYRRVEVITGTTRHLRRSDEERVRILAESFEPGANIAAVARRHGVAGGLLHYWRKCAKAKALETARADAPLFIPVMMANANEGAVAGGEAEPRCVPHGRMIAIEMAGARVQVPEGVDAKTLAIVLTALRRIS